MYSSLGGDIPALGLQRSRIGQVREDECEDSGAFVGHGLVRVLAFGEVHFLDDGLETGFVA